MCAARYLQIVFAVCFLIVSVGVAQADNLAIDNPSFEIPAIEPSVGGIFLPGTYWSLSTTPAANGGYYTMDPSGPFNDWAPPPPDGTYQILDFAANDGGIYQQLSAILEPDMTYVLSADVTERNGFTYENDASLGLGFGSLYGTNLLTPDSIVEPAPTSGGPWQSWSRTYTTTPETVGVGSYIRIDLNSGWQVMFDNIQLSATPVPEPSIMALLSAVTLSLVCYGWRKRK